MCERRIDYDDYIPDVFDDNEDFHEEASTLNERYNDHSDDGYYCPYCGARKKMFRESYECYGGYTYKEIWECPVCGN